MRILVYCRDLEQSKSLEEQIRQKSQKIEHLVPQALEAKWTCARANGMYLVQVSLHGRQMQYHAEGKSKSFYQAVDRVLRNLERQLLKSKDSCKKHIRKRENVIFLDSDLESKCKSG